MQETFKEVVIMAYLDFVAITNCMKMRTLIALTVGQRGIMVSPWKIGPYFNPFMKNQVILIYLLEDLPKKLKMTV